MRLLLALLLAAPLAAATSPETSDQAATERVIYVNEGAEPDGNGSWRLPFRNLPQAVAAAKSTSGPVVIRLAPGRYPINTTLVIDRSLVISGSTEIIETASGFPRGDTVPGTATRIVAGEALGAEPLIAVGRTDGVVIKGVTIRGLVFKGVDFFATQLTVRRVQDFAVMGNVFRTPSRFGLETIASSGQIVGNHFSGLQTGAILAAGYPASPSKVIFRGNRSEGNSLGGVLLMGASIFIPELGDRLEAVVRDNDLSHNEAFGVRLFILRRDPGFPGDTQETGHIHAVLKGNRIHANVTGVLVDAGFPWREIETGCDSRTFSGTVDLKVEDNRLSENSEDSWILLNRWPGNEQDPAFQYLHASRFTITDPQENLGHVFFHNPKRDPYVGPCPADNVQELLGNVLRYNGALLKGTNY